MATLEALVAADELIAVEGGLEHHEMPERLLFAFPDVVKWMERTLPNLEPFLDEGRQSPLEQVDSLVHDFVSGAAMAYYKRSHIMRPSDSGVWELKTPDIRLFGWFPRRSSFVIAQINDAVSCKQHDLYAGHRDMTIRLRDKLNLDEPKFIPGDYDVVL